jgi:hypothetical protein
VDEQPTSGNVNNSKVIINIRVMANFNSLLPKGASSALPGDNLGRGDCSQPYQAGKYRLT